MLISRVGKRSPSRHLVSRSFSVRLESLTNPTFPILPSTRLVSATSAINSRATRSTLGEGPLFIPSVRYRVPNQMRQDLEEIKKTAYLVGGKSVT
ncbi:Hypothetical protein NTJ_13812 [Nesidiocoris tenuis]|uniref:Uncharacterized protein n=1 Tax=Nesidiocoris tenuis TaxID=355587 RepID=A0ABN7BCS7_9HEMI|nr:Hypothetical protein NTJ_13812 [Nesidiocoris tenuis]